MADRPVVVTGAAAPPEFTEETDLALGRFGGSIVFATDDWFATAENLLSHEEPIFIPEKFTDCGKWMDGWETRRKRIAGHDWCVIKLAFPGRILGFDVDTSFFTGNFAPRCSIQAATVDEEPEAMKRLAAARVDPGQASGKMGSRATEEEIRMAESLGSQEWKTLVPFTPLGAGYKDTCHNYFPVDDASRYTHLRLNMFPDGGIARLRVYGEVARDWGRVPATLVLDLAAAENGGKAVGCSDKHYGHPRNLINPGRGINMGDGWETARKMTRPPVLEPDAQGLIKVPGSDFALLRLGTPGVVEKLEVDTKHFKGNFPESCLVEGALLPPAMGSKELMDAQDKVEWRVLLPRTKLGPDQQHFFEAAKGEMANVGPVSHLKLTMYPDGGISRLRAFGRKATDGVSRSRL